MDLLPLVVMGVAGVVVFLSWMGAGTSIMRGLRLRQDGAMAACAGMAGMAVVGGLLMAFHLARFEVVSGITLVAALGGVFAFWQRRRQILATKPPAIVLLLACAWVFLAGVANRDINPGDDKLAYIVFPRQILESGTLLAPFNVRRLGIYGGHQFLQAQVIAVARTLFGQDGVTLSVEHPHVIDHGLATVLVAWMLYALAGRQWLGLLVAGAFLVTPLPRANAHSQATGMLLFVALARALPLFIRRSNSVPLVGLLAAGIASLRMNFLAAAALMPILACLHPPRRLVSPTAPAIVLMALLLIPFAIVLQQSSGTPLYPLFKGYQHGAFLDAPLSLAAHIHWTLHSLLFPKILILLAPALLAVRLRRFRDAIPLHLAALFMTAVTAWLFTNQDTTNLFRLCSPPLFAAAFVTLAVALRRWRLLQGPERIASIVLLIAIPVVCAHEYSDLFRTTYPVIILGCVVLAAAAGSPRKNWELAAGLLTLAALAWGALCTVRTLLDSGSLFLHLFAIAITAWIALAASASLLKWIARAATAFLIALFAAGFAWTYGVITAASFGVLAAAILIAFNRHALRTSAFKAAAIAVAAALCFAILLNGSVFLDAFLPAPLARNLTIAPLTTPPVNPLRETYQHAQAMVPRGQPIFIILPEPYHLDFARNPLLAGDDSLAFISPPPGLETADSADKLRDYFLRRDIRYLLLAPHSITDTSKVGPASLRESFARLLEVHPHLTETPDLILLHLREPR